MHFRDQRENADFENATSEPRGAGDTGTLKPKYRAFATVERYFELDPTSWRPSGPRSRLRGELLPLRSRARLISGRGYCPRAPFDSGGEATTSRLGGGFLRPTHRSASPTSLAVSTLSNTARLGELTDVLSRSRSPSSACTVALFARPSHRHRARSISATAHDGGCHARPLDSGPSASRPRESGGWLPPVAVDSYRGAKVGAPRCEF